MAMSVCPAAVRALVAAIWAMLTDPGRYEEWMDIHDTRATPDGPAAPGQVVAGWSRGLGRR